MTRQVDDRRAGPDAGSKRVLVCNPASGTGDHAPEIRRRGTDRGFDVRETDGPGDARRLSREAATEGASLLAVAGGDGTVNEAVHGLVEADALEQVSLAVIPTGTANLFARRMGITDVDRAFDLLDTGTPRRIDVGVAGGRPFVNTCLAGLSAEANTATPDELKRRLGSLAYVLTTLRFLPTYDGIGLEVRIDREDEPETWQGNALLVLIGNAFRLPTVGDRERASVTDGSLEITIIEGVDGVGVLESDTDVESASPMPITRYEASSLSIAATADEPVTFSLDGELHTETALEVGIRNRCLSMYVDPGELSER